MLFGWGRAFQSLLVFQVDFAYGFIEAKPHQDIYWLYMVRVNLITPFSYWNFCSGFLFVIDAPVAVFLFKKRQAFNFCPIFTNNPSIFILKEVGKKKIHFVGEFSKVNRFF